MNRERLMQVLSIHIPIVDGTVSLRFLHSENSFPDRREAYLGRSNRRKASEPLIAGLSRIPIFDQSHATSRSLSYMIRVAYLSICPSTCLAGLPQLRRAYPCGYGVWG